MKQPTFTVSVIPRKGGRLVSIVLPGSRLHAALAFVLQEEGLDVGPIDHITIRDDFWGSENSLLVTPGEV